jgi:hypothetical protein
MNTAKGGEGGIAIGTGSAKGGAAGEQGEISIDGRLYKPTDPEYNEVKKQAMKSFTERISNIFKPNWK